jgi:hypothetical protein
VDDNDLEKHILETPWGILHLAIFWQHVVAAGISFNNNNLSESYGANRKMGTPDVRMRMQTQRQPNNVDKLQENKKRGWCCLPTCSYEKGWFVVPTVFARAPTIAFSTSLP